jgi:hypothetical protein
VPDVQSQEQRGLLRTRKQLTRERTSHTQRLQKTLEEANIKLDSVISDVTGASGRAMIEALIAGETDPLRLARLASSRIKASPAILGEALRGRVTRHHRFLLRLQLQGGAQGRRGGSAISRCRTTRSATCWWRRATWRTH